jgi:predicted phosphodiesterase
MIVVIPLCGLTLVCHSSVRSQSNATPHYAGFPEIDPKKTHFILVGDTQKTSRWEFWRERNDKERKLILDEIARREPAFLIHLGDLTTRGSSKIHWQDFDDMNRGVREKNIPYFPVLGNHDYYGNNQDALRYYFSRFRHLEQKYWYSFTWKNIGFILLDANFSNLTAEEAGQQSRWYVEELARFEKEDRVDYVIACCHQPPYTNSRTISPSEKTRSFFADPFLRFRKTRLFFSGHSHSYERFQVNGKFFVVSGGAGGPRHRVKIDSGAEPKDLFPGPELRFFHFCEIENLVDRLAIRVQRLESDGTFTAVDPFFIRKSE